MVPFLGVKQIAKNVKWKHQNSFVELANQPENSFRILESQTTNQVFGNYVKIDNLMYARIFGAGHMVMEKRGIELRDLYYKWMYNDID